MSGIVEPPRARPAWRTAAGLLLAAVALALAAGASSATLFLGTLMGACGRARRARRVAAASDDARALALGRAVRRRLDALKASGGRYRT